MKIVFMGTPEFAVPSLEALVQEGYDIPLVLTQPSRPAGRGQQVKTPPVARIAELHGIEVAQPTGVKKGPVVKRLVDLHPDLIVVVAYGHILRPNILDLPRYGCWNVHASLLPLYRGAAPIQWAIVNGEDITGVTVIHMNEGMDSGDILHQNRVRVQPGETAGELHDRLAVLGAETLIEAINMLREGKLNPRPQDDAAATYAPMLKKEDGKILWGNTAESIANQIRGLSPWPGAYTQLRGTLLKVHHAAVTEGDSTTAPGTILAHNADGMVVQAGDHAVLLTTLQLAGGRELNAEAFYRGHPIKPGERLGEA